MRLLHNGGPWGLFDFFWAAVALVAVCVLFSDVNGLRTGRRNLTIDSEGVTVEGERLRWAEIDRVELDEDGDQVVVHAAYISGRTEIHVTDRHVSDPRLFGRLLELEYRIRRGIGPGAEASD